MLSAFKIENPIYRVTINNIVFSILLQWTFSLFNNSLIIYEADINDINNHLIELLSIAPKVGSKVESITREKNIFSACIL